MKRLIALVAAIMLIAGCLAACSDTGTGTADANSGDAANTSDSVQLSTLLDKINDKYSLSGLKVMEKASDLDRYYTISESDVKQFAAELTTAASQYSEVIVIEAASTDSADAVKAKLNSHLDAQLSTAKSYDQDAVAMIESCKVEQIGDFVYLVIGENASDIGQTIRDFIQ